MKSKLFTFLSCLILSALLAGCGVEEGNSIDAEKKKWEKKGWVFLEVVGEPIEGAEYVSHMSSATSSKITAFASGSPEPIRKVYVQDESLYLVVTMGSDMMNTFSLVFSKPK